MIMNRWRVGTLTMGVVLVALGVLMLVSLVTRIDVFITLTTVWPVIMICLGVELLLNLFFKKGDGAEGKMKYDVLGILFIGFILFISVCFYGFTFFAGALGGGENMYAAFRIHNETAYETSSVEFTGADELVVFNGLDSLKVISAETGRIRVEYSVSVSTSDREYAESVVGDMMKFENGKRAYLLPNTDMYYTDRRLGYPVVNCVVALPPNTILDLSQYYGHYEYDDVLEKQIIQP